MHYSGADTRGQQAPLSTGANQIHQTNCILTNCNILTYIPNPKLDSHQPRSLELDIQRTHLHSMCTMVVLYISCIQALGNSGRQHTYTTSGSTTPTTYNHVTLSTCDHSQLHQNHQRLAQSNSFNPVSFNIHANTSLVQWYMVMLECTTHHEPLCTPCTQHGIVEHPVDIHKMARRNLHSRFPPSWAGTSTT